MKKPDTFKTPAGWFVAGSNPDDYVCTLDTKTAYRDKPSGSITSKKEKPAGFTTLMQDFSAKEYLGKRMKFSASVKSDAIANWAGLWMRVEGAGGDVLGFDNMKNRSIKGTTDWKEYTIVLDIPEDTKIIGFGILLSGKGCVWIANAQFEIVDNNTPVTNMEKSLPTKPTNLDFSL
jgi:hypothetical protein